MNVMSNLGTQPSGYHQLEPKIFPANQRAFEKAGAPAKDSRGRQQDQSVGGRKVVTRKVSSSSPNNVMVSAGDYHP